MEYSVSVENVADRAAGYSMPGLIADGMDVFHVYELAAQAVQRARDGLGPTLLECKTYRYYGHYAADNPSSTAPRRRRATGAAGTPSRAFERGRWRSVFCPPRTWTPLTRPSMSSSS